MKKDIKNSKIVKLLDDMIRKYVLLWFPCVILLSLILGVNYIVEQIKEIHYENDNNSNGIVLQRKPFALRFIAVLLVVGIVEMFVPSVNSVIVLDVFAYDDVLINDENFKCEYLRNRAINADTNGDGYLSEQEASAVKSIWINNDSGQNNNIVSLKGIEYFTSVKSINCIMLTNLEELDLSQNLDLEELILDGVTIKRINLDNNLELRKLHIIRPYDYEGTDIVTINLSNKEKLVDLYISNCNVSYLDMSNKPNLEYLAMSNNNITDFRLENNNKITRLDLNGNKLNSLSIINCERLETLYLNKCGLESMDSIQIVGCNNLKYLYMNKNNLKSADFSSIPSLKRIDCESNGLENVNINNNINLESFYCNYNNLKDIDVTNNLELFTLRLDLNMLKDINLTNNIKLNTLTIYENHLTSLDLSTCPDIFTVNADCNSYYVSDNEMSPDGTFDMSSLPDFDVSKVSNVEKATFTNGVLSKFETYDGDTNDYVQVAYDYNVSNKFAPYEKGANERKFETVRFYLYIPIKYATVPRNKYSVNFNSQDVSVYHNGQKISPSTALDSGEIIKIDAVNKTGYRLEYIKVNGVSIQRGSEYVVENENINIEAKYTKIEEPIIPDDTVRILSIPEWIIVTKNGMIIDTDAVLKKGDVIRIVAVDRPGYNLNFIKANDTYVVNGDNFVVGSNNIVITVDYIKKDDSPPEEQVIILSMPSGVSIYKNNALLSAGNRLMTGDFIAVFAEERQGYKLILKVNGTIIENGGLYLVGNEDISVTADYIRIETTPQTPYVPINPISDPIYPYPPTYPQLENPFPSSPEQVDTDNFDYPSIIDEPVIDDVPRISPKQISFSCRLKKTCAGKASMRTKNSFFDDSVEVRIRHTKSSNNAAISCREHMVGNYIVYAFDISIISVNTGKKSRIKDGGYITLELPIPKNMEYFTDDIEVWHIVNDKPQLISSSIVIDEHGYYKIRFTAYDFSPYIITTKKPVKAEDVSSGAGVTDSPVNSEIPSSPVSNGVKIPSCGIPVLTRISNKRRKFRIVLKRRRQDTIFVY